MPLHNPGLSVPDFPGFRYFKPSGSSTRPLLFKQTCGIMIGIMIVRLPK